MLRIIKANSIPKTEKRVYVNYEDLEEMGFEIGGRVLVNSNSLKSTPYHAKIEILDSKLKKGEVALSHDLYTRLDIRPSSKIIILPARELDSMKIIKQKIEHKKKYSYDDFVIIVDDIINDNFSDTEMNYFIVSCTSSLSRKECINLIKALTHSANHIDYYHNMKRFMIYHTEDLIGDYSALLSSLICSNSNISMPLVNLKNSDILNSGFNQDISILEFTNILDEKNIALYRPRDKSFIPYYRLSNYLNNFSLIDSTDLKLCLLISKCIIFNINNILLDFTISPYSRFKSKDEIKLFYSKAHSLANHFDIILNTNILNLDSDIISLDLGYYGFRKLNNTIKNPVSIDKLTEKALVLSGRILELSGSVKPGLGYSLAQSILESDKVGRKLEELLSSQGLKQTNPKLFKKDIKIKVSDKSELILNKEITDRWLKTLNFPQNPYSGISIKQLENRDNEVVISVISNSKSNVDRLSKSIIDYFE